MIDDCSKSKSDEEENQPLQQQQKQQEEEVEEKSPTIPTTTSCQDETSSSDVAAAAAAAAAAATSAAVALTLALGDSDFQGAPPCEQAKQLHQQRADQLEKQKEKDSQAESRTRTSLQGLLEDCQTKLTSARKQEPQQHHDKTTACARLQQNQDYSKHEHKDATTNDKDSASATAITCSADLASVGIPIDQKQDNEGDKSSPCTSSLPPLQRLSRHSHSSSSSPSIPGAFYVDNPNFQPEQSNNDNTIIDLEAQNETPSPSPPLTQEPNEVVIEHAVLVEKKKKKKSRRGSSSSSMTQPTSSRQFYPVIDGLTLGDDPTQAMSSAGSSSVPHSSNNAQQTTIQFCHRQFTQTEVGWIVIRLILSVFAMIIIIVLFLVLS